MTAIAPHHLLHGTLSSQVIGAFYEVYNHLPPGLLEVCYQRALAIELADRGLCVDCEFPITVRYKGRSVGEYRADLLVERTIIVECKTADRLAANHEAQMLHYLRAAGLEVGLLLLFGSQPVHKRFVQTRPRLTASAAMTEVSGLVS